MGSQQCRGFSSSPRWKQEAKPSALPEESLEANEPLSKPAATTESVGGKDADGTALPSTDGTGSEATARPNSFGSIVLRCTSTGTATSLLAFGAQTHLYGVPVSLAMTTSGYVFGGTFVLMLAPRLFISIGLKVAGHSTIFTGNLLTKLDRALYRTLYAPVLGTAKGMSRQMWRGEDAAVYEKGEAHLGCNVSRAKMILAACLMAVPRPVSGGVLRMIGGSLLAADELSSDKKPDEKLKAAISHLRNAEKAPASSTTPTAVNKKQPLLRWLMKKLLFWTVLLCGITYMLLYLLGAIVGEKPKELVVRGIDKRKEKRHERDEASAKQETAV